MSERKFRPPKIEEFPKEWESEEVHTTEAPTILNSDVTGFETVSLKIKSVDSVTPNPRAFRITPSMNRPKAVAQELEDEGLRGLDEWHKAFNLKNKVGKERKNDSKQFGALINYLDGDQKIPDREAIQKFNNSTDNAERLELLQSISLSDAIECINDYAESRNASRYLSRRLDFFQKLILGKATHISTESELNDKGQLVEVTKETPIDASELSPESIRLGVLRNLLYSAMQGTPEMGAVKIATKTINQKFTLAEKRKSSLGSPSATTTKVNSVVSLFGYYSGIHDASIIHYASIIHGASIGQYTNLVNLYKRCKEQTEKRFADQPLSDEKKEHKAVLLMAKRLEGAYEYNGVMNVSASPYRAPFKEAVAAGQLGHKVMRQLKGMRSKIQDTRLDHIERFIGKSGDSKYEPEKKRLTTQITFLKESSEQDKKQELALRQNAIEFEKGQKWYEHETERLNHKFEKVKADIEKLRLPEEEKALQLQSVTERHTADIAHVQEVYETESARLRERSPEQLLIDLEKRQIVVNEKYEKRKSLAQKALDLHFKINHTGGDDSSKPLAGIVDWINYASLGTIKRSHKMMRQGIKEESIVEYALADIIAGARGATRKDFGVVHNLLQKAKGQDDGARHTLKSMMEVGNIVSSFDYEVSIAEVASLAGKKFYGMTGALKHYNLEQVKQFMDQGVNLQSVTTTKEVTEKFGHNLTPSEIIEIASHNILGLDGALRSFDLSEVKILLQDNVNLLVAVAVLNNTRQFGYELTVTQISKVAKNIQDINDFISALKELPLEEVEKLFSVGVPYNQFSKVKLALYHHNYDSSFDASLAVAQRLAKNSEYSVLEAALKLYTLNEVNQITSKGISLAGMLDVIQALQKKSVSVDLNETIQFTKYAGGHSQGNYVKQAIDTFGVDDTRKIVGKSCRLDKAVEVRNYINADTSSRSRWPRSNDGEISDSLIQSLNRGCLDVIIAIARAGNIDAAVTTIKAGFTVEEITRFPFLISPLVTKK